MSVAPTSTLNEAGKFRERKGFKEEVPSETHERDESTLRCSEAGKNRVTNSDLEKLVRHHDALVAIGKKRRVEVEKKATHPIDNQQFATNVLTRTTGEKDYWTSKIFWVTPAARWNPFRDLS